MRARGPLAVAVLVLVALATSACGGGGSPTPRAAFAKKLNSACDDMRTKIEALGMPNDNPISKIYPGTVKIGRAFVKQIKLIDPPTAEKANATSMVREFSYYFDGLAIGYAVLVKRNSQQGFIQTVGGAEANLKMAEGYARKLDATACTRRPFT
jgi:hypothetical protein